MRLANLVIPVLLITAACSSGASAEDLEASAEPLIEAHDALKDWNYQVEGGMSNGQAIERWPDTSAKVLRLLDEFSPGDVSVDGEDRAELSEYAEAIKTAQDAWSSARNAVHEYIYDDGSENAAGLLLLLAQELTEGLDQYKENALTPGDQPDPDAEETPEES